VSFQVTGAADGVRITVSAGNAPMTNVPFDLGVPVAQSTLDSLQTSESFAAMPYPGDLVVATPGTVAGFSGGQLTPPGYPFIVRASHPVSPEGKLDQPGYSLHATADPSVAASSAGSGLRNASGTTAATQASSEARRSDEGSLRAVAGTDVAGFSTGPLTIGRVRTTAEVLVSSSGRATRRSELEATGVRVGDVAVDVTPAGITLPGSRAPLPPTSGVIDTLTRSGIDIAYLAPREGDAFAASPALAVTVTRPLEGPVTPLRVTYVLGRSVARVETSAGPPLLSAPELPAASEPTTDGSAPGSRSAGDPVSTAAPPAAPSPAGVGGIRTAPASLPGAAISGGQESSPLAGATPEVSLPTEAVHPPLAQQRIGLAPPEFGAGGSYSLLVLAGLVLVAVTQLYRTITIHRVEVS
jgi:hypothetical protein